MRTHPRRRARALLAAVLTAVLTAVLVGCTAAPTGEVTAPGAQLQQLVDRWRERTEVPAVTVAVAAPDRRVVAASGTTHRDGEAPVTVDAQFRVASITKMFIATVVLQLVQEGRLGLDDPLADYMPGFALGQGVTIRQLLNHTSGIPDYSRAEGYKKGLLTHRERRWSADEVLDLVSGVRRDFSPGTDYSYSNTGYILLSRVIDAVGSTWAAEIRRRILDPLRLEHTYISGFEPMPGGIGSGVEPAPAGLVPGYFDADEDGHQEEIDTGRPWPSLEALEAAAGAVVSTAPDLATFGAALFGGRLLRPATVAQMVTEGPHHSRNSGYGLGVEILRPDYRQTLWGHSGFTFGFKSGLWYVPRHDLVVVALANDSVASPSDLAELVVRADLSARGE